MNNSTKGLLFGFCIGLVSASLGGIEGAIFMVVSFVLLINFAFSGLDEK